ncbi:hypothetical protein ACWDLG_15475 [Nonomuraea sp. NPDC003727]
MASESNTYTIKTGEAPEAGQVTASADQIKVWLDNTDSAAVVRAADAYSSAASMIGLARESLMAAAKGLSEMWGGPTAALFQAGLHKLDTTGDELATKMKAVSTALSDYGGTHLPDAVTKVNAIEPLPGTSSGSSEPAPTPTVTTTPSPTSKPSATATPKPSPGPTPLPPGSDPVAEAKARRDEKARQILEDLNKQIVSLYAQVPDEVSYDLEIPAPPSATDGYQSTSYTSRDRYQPAFRGGTPDAPAFEDGDTRPGTGGGVDRPGTGGSGQGPGTGSGEGDSDGDGSTPTNPEKPGTPPGTPPGTGTPPPGGDPTVPGGNGDPGTGTGPGGTGRGDGTTPPVIGQDDGSRQTETASYRPLQTPPTTPSTTPTTTPTLTTPTTPYTQIPATTPPTISTTPGLPNTVVGPTNGAPGVPSVIGGGTLGGQNAVTSAAARAGYGTGMPHLMGGLGGTIGGGGENEENTHTTNLREDRNPWASSHDVTTDLLGRTGEA